MRVWSVRCSASAPPSYYGRGETSLGKRPGDTDAAAPPRSRWWWRAAFLCSRPLHQRHPISRVLPCGSDADFLKHQHTPLVPRRRRRPQRRPSRSMQVSPEQFAPGRSDALRAMAGIAAEISEFFYFAISTGCSTGIWLGGPRTSKGTGGPIPAPGGGVSAERGTIERSPPGGIHVHSRPPGPSLTA